MAGGSLLGSAGTNTLLLGEIVETLQPAKVIGQDM